MRRGASEIAIMTPAAAAKGEEGAAIWKECGEGPAGTGPTRWPEPAADREIVVREAIGLVRGEKEPAPDPLTTVAAKAGGGRTATAGVIPIGTTTAFRDRR
jgi:hypothetical protein